MPVGFEMGDVDWRSLVLVIENGLGIMFHAPDTLEAWCYQQRSAACLLGSECVYAHRE